jgi:hypothetical protein
MFAQGGFCFFCNAQLPRAEASVEHLVPLARAGSNSDDNCVACCKAMNTLLGSMSLKEKIKVVLNQKGQFKCPNGAGHVASASLSTSSAPKLEAGVPRTTITAVIENLRSRGGSRPRKMKTLASTIKAVPQLKLDDKQVKAIIEYLRSSGKIVISGEQVSYKL